jgi:hypothetical protein
MNWRGAGDPVARFSRVRTLVSVSALLALTAVAANAAAPPPKLDLRAVPVPPPTFSHLPPTWRAFATPGDLTPRGAQAGVFATSWPYRLTTVAGPAGSMPRDAVLVNVFLIRSNPGKQSGSLCGRTPHLAGYPPVRSLPLQLPTTTTATLDGPAWPEYRVFGRLGESYNFEVRVDVSNRHPSAKLLRLARLVVAAIDFPRWPRPTTC